MTKNQQQTIAIAVGLVLAVFIGAYALIIGPQWKAAKETRTEVDDLTAQLTAAQSQAGSLRAQAAGLDTLVDGFDTLTSRFPTTVSEESVLSDVFEIAENLDIRLINVGVIPPVDLSLITAAGGAAIEPPAANQAAAGAFGTFPIAVSSVGITGSGTIDQQRRFIAELRALPRPIFAPVVRLQDGEFNLAARIYLTRPLALPNEDGSTSEGQMAAPQPTATEATPGAIPSAPVPTQ